METKQIELMPDVWLTTVRTRKFKTSCWGLQLLTPLKRDTAAMNALLPSVLRRGTARLPDQASITAELDELYGGSIEPTVSKRGDMQCIGFRAYFLDESCLPGGAALLERAAGLLGELLLHPATRNGRLRQDYVLSERDNLIRRIESRRNNKRLYAAQRIVEEMFAHTDYAVSRLGTLEEAQRITAMKLFRQYREVLEHAPIELFYCGSAPAEQVELAWREALMGLPRAQTRYLVTTDSRRPPFEKVIYTREQMSVRQGKLEMGFRVGFGISDAMYPALMVANAMFGGTPGSRLFRHVREKRGLCYYASSDLRSLKGFLTVSCGVDPANFAAAEEEILAQLTELQEGNFTDEEFEAAKRSVLRSMELAEDDPAALRNQWVRDRAGGEPFEIDRFRAQVRDVTETQAAAAAMEIVLYNVYELTRGEEGDEA